jgi:hypothetical protein
MRSISRRCSVRLRSSARKDASAAAEEEAEAEASAASLPRTPACAASACEGMNCEADSSSGPAMLLAVLPPAILLPA